MTIYNPLQLQSAVLFNARLPGSMRRMGQARRCLPELKY
jgi:hypothetical protein